MADIQVRRLQAKDLFTVASIIGEIWGELQSELKGQDLSNIDEQYIGVILMKSGINLADTKIKRLLADISGMTPEEFDKQSFDFPLEVLEKVAEQEDIGDFLQKAQKLIPKFTGKLSI